MRLRRELIGQAAMMERAAEQQRAQYEAAMYANYVDCLVSVHKEAWRPWDWQAVASSQAPAPPQFVPRFEPAARQALASYQPTLTEKVLGKAEPRRPPLRKRTTAQRSRRSLSK